MLTEQQISQRHKYIGSSDAAAVLGLNRWKTLLQVWAEKTGRIIPDDISGRIPVRMGNKLEDAVAELFMEETGKTVHRVRETLFHSKHDFIGANLDRRVVGERALLEIKTASGWKAKEWSGEDIPQEYVIQVLHQLACCPKYDKAYIACLIGNEQFIWKEIQRDQSVIDQLVAKEVSFWNNHVISGEMPVQLTDDDGTTLYRLFPTSDPNADIILDDEANVIIEQIEAMKTEYDLLGKDIETKRNELKAMLKEAQQGRTDKFRITWKEQAGSTYTVERKPTRVLRFNKIK